MSRLHEHGLGLLALGGVVLGLTALTLTVLGVPLGEAAGLFLGGRAGYVVRTVAVGAAIVGVAGGVLGSFAVMRRQSLLGDAVSHAALPGIYLVFMAWSALGLSGLSLGALTLPPARSLPVVLAGALLTGLLAMGLILLTTRRTKLKEDAALGLTLSIFFGAGIALRSALQNRPRTFGSRAGLEAFLVGSAATMTRADLLFLGATTAIALAIVLLFWKELKLLTFDPDGLAAQGFPVRALDVLLTGLIVVAVIVGLQMVGVILMSALLIAPAVAARQWTDRFATMVLLAAAFGAISGLVGVTASSLRAYVATGPIIAVYATSLALLSLLLAPRRGLLWSSIRRAGLRRRFAVDTLLLHLEEQGGAQTRDLLLRQLGWSPRALDRAADRARDEGWLVASDGRLALADAGRARVSEQLAALRGVRALPA